MTSRRSFLIGAVALMVTPFAVKPPRGVDGAQVILEVESWNEDWGWTYVTTAVWQVPPTWADGFNKWKPSALPA